MGVAIEGSPLGLEDTQEASAIVRRIAAEQCLAVWKRQKNRHDPDPLWGDEIEFALVNLDADSPRATMFLGQQEVLEQWEADSERRDKSGILQWEWASYVVETTPTVPYTGKLSDLTKIEENIRQRRALIDKYLPLQTHAIPLCVFPRTGVIEGWTSGPSTDLMCSQARYKLLSQSFESRSQGTTKTWHPIYRDSCTPTPFVDSTTPEGKREDKICLDHQDIGRGCCSIQTTFQSPNEAEARWLHDQLIPLGPCFLAMTAATSIWKGVMVDTDSRWQRYGDIADDRSPAEKDALPPRWIWNQSYLSKEQPTEFSGQHSIQPMDIHIREYLINGGMDHFLADHFASILSRDPLILTEEDTKSLTPDDTRLFETLYGFVWNHVRFKPPTSDKGPGWRVEFRPMEVQLTDFENSAFAIFCFLLSRAIACFHLNLYIPIHLVGESWSSCQKRDAVIHERFWFRQRDWLPNSNCSNEKLNSNETNEKPCADRYALMTAKEIMNGQGTTGGFPGLLFFVRCYLDHVKASEKERKGIEPYLSLIHNRASGISPTPAAWMRKFVFAHEDYNKDSQVSEVVCYDMMKEILSMNGA